MRDQSTQLSLFTRQCPKCGEVRGDADFYGYSRVCKPCHRAKQRAYYAENAEKVKAYQQQYRQENKDKIRARDHAYWQKNRERLLVWHREHYAKTAEAKKPQRREYHAKNAQQVRQRVRNWRIANPEKRREQSRLYHQRHPEAALRHQQTRVARMRGVVVEPVDFAALLERCGRVCYLCYEPIDDDLQWDHVIPIARGGPHTEANLRPTHGRCNRRKNDRILRPGAFACESKVLANRPEGLESLDLMVECHNRKYRMGN